MGRNPCCSKEEMNKGAWTALEDKILTDYIKTNGEGKWRNIPKQAGLKRCGKSCRLRWLNYLRPDIKRGNISLDEEDLIIRLHNLLGNRWSLIAGRLPGRTDNEIKNYWNTNLAKKSQIRQSNKSQNEKNPMINPPNDGFPRASKCTDFVATPQQGMTDNFNTKMAKMAPSMNCNMVKNMGMESGSSEDSPLFEFRNENLSDFSMDFDMGEICLSEILGSDFTTNFNNVTQHDGTDNEHVQVDEDSDLRALASFFESAEEWLGGDNPSLVYPY